MSYNIPSPISTCMNGEVASKRNTVQLFKVVTPTEDDASHHSGGRMYLSHPPSLPNFDGKCTTQRLRIRPRSQITCILSSFSPSGCPDGDSFKNYGDFKESSASFSRFVLVDEGRMGKEESKANAEYHSVDIPPTMCGTSCTSTRKRSHLMMATGISQRIIDVVQYNQKSICGDADVMSD